METTVRGLMIYAYLFFKEFFPQFGVCGRYCFPQVSVPFSNNVSSPVGLDSKRRYLKTVTNSSVVSISSGPQALGDDGGPKES